MTQTLPARPWTEPTSAEAAWKLAQRVVASAIAPVKRVEDAFVMIATGAELGLSPMQALRMIHVVKNKPVLSADLMVALCKRSPVCRSWRVVESTDDVCTIETHHVKSPEPERLTFTIEQARRAKLTGSSTWASYPAQMLRAACSRQLARMVYPDLVGGIYDEEELATSPIQAEHAPPLRVVSPPVQERPTQELAEVGAYWIGQLTVAGIAESDDDARNLLWSRAKGFAEGKVTAEDVAAAGKAICLEAQQVIAREILESECVDVEDQIPPAALGDSPSTFGEAQSEVMDATGCSDLDAEQAIVTAREILDTEEWGAVITKAVSLVESRREKGAA